MARAYLRPGYVAHTQHHLSLVADTELLTFLLAALSSGVARHDTPQSTRSLSMAAWVSMAVDEDTLPDLVLARQWCPFVGDHSGEEPVWFLLYFLLHDSSGPARRAFVRHAGSPKIIVAGIRHLYERFHDEATPSPWDFIHVLLSVLLIVAGEEPAFIEACQTTVSSSSRPSADRRWEMSTKKSVSPHASPPPG
jgi:hypothetical protein